MTHRVLIVEDDIHAQGYCKTVLEAAGFTVDACDSAASARELFKDNRPDMAVLDIGLPDGSGIDLMREWHTYPGPKVPVLFLTGRGDLKTRLACFKHGAQDYLAKPFASEELLARVTVHLQVKKSHEELVKRNYELELVARARQDMTDMIVHDLKAPLTAIKGTLELIRGRGLITQDDYSCLLQTAGSAADFMLLMLNDMLDLAQAKQTGLKIHVVSIDIEPLLGKIKTLFTGRMQTRKSSLVTRVSPGLLVRADQNLLYRILANLVVNALKADHSGTPIEIECLPHGESMRFAVSDRGPGVPDAEKKSIFEKYVTSGRKDTALDTGTGIGLSFCSAAVAAHKGRIWVEDRPGGGSRFLVDLPR